MSLVNRSREQKVDQVEETQELKQRSRNENGVESNAKEKEGKGREVLNLGVQRKETEEANHRARGTQEHQGGQRERDTMVASEFSNTESSPGWRQGASEKASQRGRCKPKNLSSVERRLAGALRLKVS